MNEQPVLDRIESLVEEEHRLWRASESGGLTDQEQHRLQSVPDPPNDLDGPDPEPPHLEHGVHDNQPSPDPGVNPNVP